MNKENILNQLLDEVYQLESYIHQWRDTKSVSAIEKDIVLKKLQVLYDQIRQVKVDDLSEIQQPEPVVEVKKVATPPLMAVETPVIEDTKHEMPAEPEPFVQEPEVKPSPPDAEVIPPVNQVPPQPPSPSIVPETKSAPVPETVVETDTEKSKAHAKEILADKLAQPQTLINEIVAKTRNVQDVSSRLKSTPIESIQSAINLNDKFLFIRELFKNNSLLYNQTIERLNSAAGYTGAMDIIEREFAWDMDDPLVSKLIDLINRKHNA